MKWATICRGKICNIFLKIDSELMNLMSPILINEDYSIQSILKKIFFHSFVYEKKTSNSLTVPLDMKMNDVVLFFKLNCIVTD